MISCEACGILSQGKECPLSLMEKQGGHGELVNKYRSKCAFNAGTKRSER